MFDGLYKGRRVLVTGHTGFKGSWLSLWLSELGAQVSGVSLAPPTQPNHWDLLHLNINGYRQDIRDLTSLSGMVKRSRPEIVFHLAAQPLVRHSYAHPVETWSTNVLGTVNLLEACRSVDDLKAIIVITTDKCYENKESNSAYKETDRLGGHDPYSASKACAELVAASYRDAFFAQKSTLLATARAGNVIGGGDWSADRLIPDAVRSLHGKIPLVIRNPNATRPWQHVLESLSGYLMLGAKLFQGESTFANAWNFGPRKEDNRTVADILAEFKKHWPQLEIHGGAKPSLHESQLLMLDSAKAHKELHWDPVWQLDQAIASTAAWYQAYLQTGKAESKAQLYEYITAARQAGRAWSA